MNFTVIGIFVFLYVFIMPLCLRLMCVAHTRLFVQRAEIRAMEARKKGRKVNNIPAPLWGTIRERVGFVFRDSREMTVGKRSVPVQNRIVFFALWGIGLVSFLFAAATSQWLVILAGIVFFNIAIIFGTFAPKALLETRKKAITKILNISKSRLSVPGDASSNEVIQVLEWRDFVKPKKVVVHFPDTFSADSSEGFMRQFNQVFGVETTWVPVNDQENGVPGWDFENSKVTIGEVPPLPTRAEWHERYVLDPGIAYSFFPLALGVENGIAMPNPETGKIENVLGFDVAGEAVKQAQQAGYEVDGSIVTSPMALVAGGTGGGKALSLMTPVLVIKKAPNRKLPMNGAADLDTMRKISEEKPETAGHEEETLLQ